MSLRGRHVIDRIKASVGRYLKLPCPPYDNPRYWDGVYKSLGPQDVYEWGSMTLQDDLLEFDYKLLLNDNITTPSKADTSITHTCTLANAIGVNPDDDDKPIILLGCGNSKLGEDMAQHGWRGPLIQVDIVSRVLDTMALRCSSLVESGVMEFVEDDATQLSAFDDAYANAVIDKGLVDALFCADETQVDGVVSSVHRVLKPGGIFLFFSLSQPEFLMPQIISTHPEQEQKWRNVQVRQLESILMYRLEKDDGSRQRKGPTRESLKRKMKSKRQ